jgi:two-component system, sensor histidine kinase and response regulator
MTIARRLWLGFGFLILIFILASLIVLLSEGSISRSLTEIAQVEEPTRAAAYEMEINTVKMSRDVLGYLDTGDPQYRERFAEDKANFERSKARYDDLADTPTGRSHRARIDSLYAEYAALGESLIDRRNELTDPNGPIRADLQRFAELEAELDGFLEEEVQPWTSQQLAEAVEEAGTAIRNVYIIIVALVLAGLLVGVLAATLINRGIVGSLRRLKEGADTVGRGDLDHRIDLRTSDEFGAVAAAFNDMLDKRREANAAVRESEERFRSLSDATFEGIAISEDGMVLETNRAFAEMFGYEPSEVVGMSALDLIAPESREMVREKISSGFEEPYETVGLKKDGTRFDLEVRGRAFSYRGLAARVAAVRDITERNRAAEELRKSEERYRLVTLATNEAIWDSDLLTDRQIWDGAIEVLFGYSVRQETDSAWWEERIHPEDSERVLSSLNAVLEGDEEMWSEEYRFRRADGGYSTVVDRAYVARDERGEPVRMIGSMMDITERKRAELAVRENERRVRQLFNQSVDALFVHDDSGKIVDCNEEACRSLGYSREELLSLRIKDIASDLVSNGEERPRTKPTLWQRALSGEPGEVAGVHRGKHRRKDGTTFPVEVYVGSVDYGGERMILASARDVTERRRAEELLQEAEARYRTLVEKMPAVTYLQEIGSPDAAMYMSPQIETLTGYSPEDCKDPDLRFRMVHPDDRERIRSQDEQTGEPGEVITTEYRVIHRDGRIVWVRNEAVIVEDEASGTRYWQGFMVDITERKRAEEALVEAREAAEEANRAKSEFLANMSHEIRTPMNGVIGMTSLLLDTELSPEQRECAETIRISGENLLTIINDILDFSKIEAGSMDLETIDFDLGTTVEESVGLHAERAHAKGLELASLIEQSVPTALRGDPGRLTQVLTNLLSNAIKFTEEGEVILRVRLAEESSDVATVRFEVTDTGIGMSEEQCSRIFQSFAQADASTTRRYGGTGLGLAISKQLVEMMAGEIGAESAPGHGSTFWFTARLEKQPEGAPRQLPYPRTDLQGLRVLVVDDNETNRKIVHEQVISWGMGNGRAQNGPSALKMLRSAAEKGEPCDLAILDLNMPGMDGMELAHRIKTDPTISSTRLILLTSLGLRGEAEQAKKVGFSAYLTKPVRQSRLYDTIATVMNLPEEGAQTPEHATAIITRHSLEEARAHARERLSSRAHVLVAEDNAVNQKVAVRMLERLGYRADVAANGLEALEALSRISYAAVLMDVQMPEMDGYEATKEIRKREGVDRHTPIIAMTANAMEGDREKALEAGMDDYVSKPVKPEKLELVLGHWILQRESSETEAPLDERALASLRELQQEGEPDFVGELIELFLHDAPPQLAALRDAIEEEDADSVELIAHTLKGSSGSMGAKKMAEICAELQNVGASGDPARAPRLFERLEEEFGRVRPALEAELARSQG